MATSDSKEVTADNAMSNILLSLTNLQKRIDKLEGQEKSKMLRHPYCENNNQHHAQLTRLVSHVL